MDQTDGGGGDPTDQIHRNDEAISAVVDEGFLGEDDDYEDLYNDVNVGEGLFIKKDEEDDVGKSKDNIFNKVDVVGFSKDDVFNRVEAGNIIGLGGNDMVERGSGEVRVGLGQDLNKVVDFESQSQSLTNNRMLNIGVGQHHVGNASGGDGLGRQGSVNVNGSGSGSGLGSGGNGYGNGGGGGMNNGGSSGGGGMNIGGGSGGMNIGGGGGMNIGGGGGMNIGGGGGGGMGVGGGVGGGGGTVLFVGDLQWWTTDAELEGELCKYGNVKEVKFFDEKASGKSKGYCQVEFYEPAAAIACNEGMNGHVFNGRPCVVAFASPYSVKRMGEAQVNRNQPMGQASVGQPKRGVGDVPGKTGGGNMPAGGNFQGGGDNNNRGYGRGNWGRGNGQGMGGRGGRGGRGMMGNGGNGFGPPHMMHPQSMMGQGFDPSFGGPMGRMGGYGGFPGGPTPPFSGMMPSFPPVGNVGLPGLAPHVNPAFFGRGMPMNGMGMMPTSGADGNMGMWSDSNMPGWTGDEHGGRVGESSYGEEAASDQQFGEGSHDRGDWSNPAKEKDRRQRDDGDREVGYERDLLREKDVHQDEWPERRHRDERDHERSRDRDRDRDRERSRDRDRDRDRERSRDRDRGRDRHRDERDRYAEHHRYREAEPEYDDEWDRGRSSRAHGKSRLAQEDEHRSRSRDADYGKKRRVTAE